ncbi:lactosylceramide 4-alpha-galactosyltransferase isoform X4 [Elgaria multicarinata webbii]|uniref:lactosylceramide 4-alpha-galactosyltransferase isoform X4 n=1 Tax=Elgaria multicarinata webbii TaxID=159646 RepID=UPI002FCD1DB8
MSNIQKPVGEYFSLPFWTKLTSKQAPGGGTRAVMEAAELKTSKQNNKYTVQGLERKITQLEKGVASIKRSYCQQEKKESGRDG